MADFLLSVGADVDESYIQLQKDIKELSSRLAKDPVLVKVSLDADGVSTKVIEKQLDTKKNIKKISKETSEDETVSLNKQIALYNKISRLVDSIGLNMQRRWTAATNTHSGVELSGISDFLSNLKEQDLSDSKIFDTVSQSVAEAELRIKDLNHEIQLSGKNTKAWGDRITGLASKFNTWFTLSQAIMAAYSTARKMITAVVELDTAMTELKKVTNETDEVYEKFLDNASTRAKNLGAALSDTVTATADFARLGYNLKEAEELADAAIVYKNVGDGIEDISEASESIIATMQAFGIAAEDSMSVVDKFNETGNNYAISSKGVGDALLRSAAAMDAANNSLDETIVLFINSPIYGEHFYYRRKNMLKIMINPEHGGSDGGAAYFGLVEKTLNLNAAKYCKAYLESYNCTPFLSRDKDIDMGISKRIELLKSRGANAVVTIAHNAGGGDGCEIFYWKGDSNSKKFAMELEAQYKAIGQNSRGIKQSSENSYNFGMVREPSKIGVVAVLSEFAFLDNASDKTIVDSDADIRKEGEAIAKAIVKYFGLKKKEDVKPEEPIKPEEPTNKNLYRVGTGWSNGKCLGQKGAFAVYENAINFSKELGKDYKVFDWNGKVVYPESQTPPSTTPYKGMPIKLSKVPLYGSATSNTPANTINGTYYIYDGININGRYRITTSKDKCGKTPVGANVTGYINSSAINYDTPASSPTAPYAGMPVQLNNTPLYGSASSGAIANRLTGTYYLYDGIKISGRYRVTVSKDKCGKTPVGSNVTGYINASVIKS